MRGRDAGDVRALCLLGVADVGTPQQVGVDAVPGLRLAGARLEADRLQARPSHQLPHAVPAGHDPLPPQVATHLPAAVERALQVQLADAPLQRQRGWIGRLRPAVARRPARRQQLELPAQARGRRLRPD